MALLACGVSFNGQEVDRLNEAGEAQAAGAKAMLEESRAQVEEVAARSQLVEVKASQDVALAKKEVHIYMVIEACMTDVTPCS